MEIHLDAVSAVLPSRLAVLLDGPDQTAVLARLAAAGDRSVPFADLVALVAEAGTARAEAAGVVRALLTRLEAAGFAERIGGGFRLTGAPLLRSPGGAAPSAPAFILPPPGGGEPAVPATSLPPPAPVDVAAYLQRLLVPVSATPAGDAARGGPPAGAWSPVAAPAGLELLMRDGGAPRLLLVTGPAGVPTPAGEVPPPATLPMRLADVAAPGTLLLRPAPPGPANPTPATAGVPTVPPPAIDRVAALLVPSGTGPAPRPLVVADGPGVPLALAVLGRVPGARFVFDVRGAGLVAASAPPTAAAASPGPAPPPAAMDVVAAAVAGAAGVSAPPDRRRAGAAGRVSRLSQFLEVLLGPGLTDLFGDDEAADEDPDDGAAPDGARLVGLVFASAPPPGIDTASPEVTDGLLGVTVSLDLDDDRVYEEVLAFLEDGDEPVVITPAI